MKAVALHRTEGSLHAFADVLAAVPGDDSPAARNQIDQALEGKLHRFQIAIDIGVVELNRGEDHRVGKVMQKLRSLVEESRVVFIAFDDEFLALS